MGSGNNCQVRIVRPQDVFELVGRGLQTLEREEVMLICLDSQNAVINSEKVAGGAVDMALLRPRDVFEPALKNSAASVVLVHNHPSGSPYPSDADVEVTKRLVRIGKLIGVQIRDHVIIGNGGFTSLRAFGVIR
ncbi:MAG: JAB domain-containing protein [Candidatus Hadarchaeum sp.]